MKKKNLLTRTWNNLATFGERHEQEIYLGLKLTGLVTTAVLAWRAGAKADKLIATYKDEVKEIDERTDISEQEKAELRHVKTAGVVRDLVPVVLPTVIVGGATATTDILNYRSVSKKIAFLTAAYNISEREIKTLQDKAEELFGKKKAEELKDETNIDMMQRAFEAGGKNEIVETGKGQVLFYDKVTGIFFRSSWDAVRAAATEVMANWNAGYYDNDDEVRYVEFLYEIGLGVASNSEAAHAFCFVRDRHTHKAEIRLRPSTGSVIFPETQESATVVEFADEPVISGAYVVHDF